MIESVTDTEKVDVNALLHGQEQNHNKESRLQTTKFLGIQKERRCTGNQGDEIRERSRNALNLEDKKAKGQANERGSNDFQVKKKYETLAKTDLRT